MDHAASRAVQDVAAGHVARPIDASFCLASGHRVQPRIFAVRRRKRDQRVESIDILFNDAELPPATTTMKPELAALSITLEYAVRFRYQLLEPFADRQLEPKDVLDFQNRRTALFDRRCSTDASRTCQRFGKGQRGRSSA